MAWLSTLQQNRREATYAVAAKQPVFDDLIGNRNMFGGTVRPITFAVLS
jgi:hypothetical protein